MFARTRCVFGMSLCLALLLTAGCGLHAQPTEKDVVYGTVGDAKLLLDVYRPTTPGPHPAVIAIHGGAWRTGDKSMHRRLGDLLAGGGVACFAVDYRLAPKYKWPAQALDVAQAVRWVRAHAKQYDVDPERLAAWGESAGGHLSLMLGTMKPGDYQEPDDPNNALSARVQCVADFYGPADFTVADKWPRMIVIGLEGFIGASPKVDPGKWADASPVTHVTADAAPTIIIQGDADRLNPPQQSQTMKAALDKAGVEDQIVIVKGAGHGLKGGDPTEVKQAYLAAFTFLAKHLGFTLPKNAGLVQ